MLGEEFNARNGGLQLREVAGGWQFATRAEYHEQVRAFLKTRPSAKLTIASLETLAVIAYRQPITVPEILEIRGVQSPSSIKTLLDKKLIVAKGRKDTVGKPMMYGTSKDFLLQFGLKDLSEFPSVEDFHDLSGGLKFLPRINADLIMYCGTTAAKTDRNGRCRLTTARGRTDRRRACDCQWRSNQGTRFESRS